MFKLTGAKPVTMIDCCFGRKFKSLVELLRLCQVAFGKAIISAAPVQHATLEAVNAVLPLAGLELKVGLKTCPRSSLISLRGHCTHQHMAILSHRLMAVSPTVH